MKFLLQFRGLHNDLRLPEFFAVLSAVRNVPETSLNIHLQPAFSHLTGLPTPIRPLRGHAGSVLYGEIFFYADLQSEKEAIDVARRTVLLRAVYKPVGHGRDYASCVSSIDKHPFENALKDVRDCEKKPTFRCHVDAFGKKLNVDQQLFKIHQFTTILQSFPGKVRMRNPQHELWILEDSFPSEGHGHTDDYACRDTPRQVFIALKLASGQGHIRESYSLKKRKYIGPTSMDAELSFVMANMARVRPGDLVNDPFCGTCSILVACAKLGASTVASDINILTLRGKGENKTILSNFDQYGIQPPLSILRADVMNPPFRNGHWFDAIVCDPPYGIKEGTRAFRADVVDESHEKNHFQGTQRVRFIDFLQSILSYAASVLVPNGRLVYWLPTTLEYSPDDVPTHPALKLIHNNEQPLTIRMSRRLITMRRLSHDEEIESRKKMELQGKQSNGKSNEDPNDENRPTRLPAHFDLACKLMRQPERAEDRLPQRKKGVS